MLSVLFTHTCALTHKHEHIHMYTHTHTHTQISPKCVWYTLLHYRPNNNLLIPLSARFERILPLSVDATRYNIRPHSPCCHLILRCASKRKIDHVLRADIGRPHAARAAETLGIIQQCNISNKIHCKE